MICTAAGREGINLQHARVLFNFDLPWNPMDLEQRIGRIHRYGQKNTAQVYNLVLSDTIEGRIFLLLDDKLKEIAKAVGKVDEHGEVAEDLRSQILGQLSERLNYQALYSQALDDPELKRTQLELEAAVNNAKEARDAVFELFQALDGFSMDEYKPLSDTTKGMSQIIQFLRTAVQLDGGTLKESNSNTLMVAEAKAGYGDTQFTTDRDTSLEDETLELMGLDHPLVVNYMKQYRDLSLEEIGVRVKSPDNRSGVLSLWHITTQGDKGETKTIVLPLGVDTEGQRVPAWERQADNLFQAPPAQADSANRQHLLTDTLEPMILRELTHRGIISENRAYDAKLIGWVEVV